MVVSNSMTPNATPSSASAVASLPVHAWRLIDRSRAEQRWENEGGRLRNRAGTSTAAATEADRAHRILAAQAMADRLASDFSEGRVGTHHNIFAHRLRVVRQLAAAAAAGGSAGATQA